MNRWSVKPPNHVDFRSVVAACSDQVHFVLQELIMTWSIGVQSAERRYMARMDSRRGNGLKLFEVGRMIIKVEGTLSGWRTRR